MKKKEKLQKEGIHEIFHFYAKQQQLIGKNSGFEELLSSLTTFNMGKFFKFLRDVELLDVHKHKERKVLTRLEAKQLYCKFCDVKKIMTYD